MLGRSDAGIAAASADLGVLAGFSRRLGHLTELGWLAPAPASTDEMTRVFDEPDRRLPRGRRRARPVRSPSGASPRSSLAWDGTGRRGSVRSWTGSRTRPSAWRQAWA